MIKHSLRQLVICLTLASAATTLTDTAHADEVFFDPTIGSYGSAIVGGIDNAGCTSGPFFQNSATCYFQSSQSPDGVANNLSDATTSASATAAASLFQGTISASATGLAFTPNVGSGFGNVHALIWNTLTFHGAAPNAVGTIVVSGTAALQNQTQDGQNVTVGAVGLVANPDAISMFSLLDGNFETPLSNGPYTISTPFSIQNDVPMWFAVALSATAGGAGCCDPGQPLPPEGIAFVSDPFSLELPAGVTVTSAAPLEPAPVPEPSTLALLLTGLVSLGIARRRS